MSFLKGRLFRSSFHSSSSEFTLLLARGSEGVRRKILYSTKSKATFLLFSLLNCHARQSRQILNLKTKQNTSLIEMIVLGSTITQKYLDSILFLPKFKQINKQNPQGQSSSQVLEVHCWQVFVSHQKLMHFPQVIPIHICTHFQHHPHACSAGFNSYLHSPHHSGDSLLCFLCATQKLQHYIEGKRDAATCCTCVFEPCSSLTMAVSSLSRQQVAFCFPLL